MGVGQTLFIITLLFLYRDRLRSLMSFIFVFVLSSFSDFFGQHFSFVRLIQNTQNILTMNIQTLCLNLLFLQM